MFHFSNHTAKEEGGGKRERERNTFALGSWNGVKGRGERGEREDPLKGRRLQEEEREEKKKLAFKKKKTHAANALHSISVSEKER